MLLQTAVDSEQPLTLDPLRLESLVTITCESMYFSLLKELSLLSQNATGQLPL